MLQQHKEALERDVREAASAPALAEAARRQGMIPTRDTAHLVQDPDGNWVVVGTPKPADGVPPPPLNTKLPEDPPPPPKPAAVPLEVPVRVTPGPDDPAPPARSGPEVLVRTPDGTATLGGATHLPTQAGPQLPGPVPIPGAPVRCRLLRSAQCHPRHQRKIRCRSRWVRRPRPGSLDQHRWLRRPGCRVGRNPWWHHPLQCRPTANSSVPSRAGANGAGGSQVSRAAPRRASQSQSTRPARGLRRPPGAQEVGQRKRPGKTQKARQAQEATKSRPATRSDVAPAGRSTRARRTRQVVDVGTRGASFVFRHRTGNAVILVLMLVAATQLFFLQVSHAAGLRAQAAGQLKVTDVQPAARGSIVDRNNDRLAFTIEARALTFQPKRIRRQLEEARKKTSAAPDPQQRLRDIAQEVAGKLNNKPDAAAVLKKLQSDETFVYLARAVDPAVASAICAKYPEVGAERQDLRQYPGGSLAANVVGGIDWDGHGLLGLEDSLDAVLAGTDGSVTYDRGSDGVVIPGSYRNRHKAVHGSTVVLTLDNDIQFYVQQQVQQAKNLSGAHNVSAVVLDAKTGEVLAMANDNTFDPSQDIGRQGDKQLGNPAVSSPFEPGSVNKIVAASAVIEHGLSSPDEVLQVPGSIQMGGVTVHDAWEHGVMPYTTTGVFGKSSNVGTLMLSQRVGPERYYDMLRKFGLGQRTGVGLPGESAGLVPPIDQWSAVRSLIFLLAKVFR